MRWTPKMLMSRRGRSCRPASEVRARSVERSKMPSQIPLSLASTVVADRHFDALGRNSPDVARATDLVAAKQSP